MNTADSIGKIKRLLAEQGYKLTPQREVTLQVLMDHKEDHLSAEEVYMLVKNRFPDIGLATVYRTLELLVELKVIVKVIFKDGVAHYDWRSEDNNHLSHRLVCSRCGHLHKISEDWLLEMEEKLYQEYGFRVLDHRLDFIGQYLVCQRGGHCQRECKEVS
ncbi:Fur family transcriptional regulator [Paenibacillus sp. 32O-W]|uniref:Fur family transcriptional regulator n=1 Tax=Paenibacillus sp. 32O-W TaxID=1695218 RepID=UPI0011A50EFF|nr:transcriptional repressor [Paenibacillus sp. 32O-W]